LPVHVVDLLLLVLQQLPLRSGGSVVGVDLLAQAIGPLAIDEAAVEERLAWALRGLAP